ncbi:Alpha/beta hydrolase family-domain-containing protein [Aspergillus stella-maris]|uniref:Alpha/beta hydrolase family-domain-containing protein n=1 Tax=Aspergillus stella-maris TaxID=1810926 RepID=UPI003CCDDB62
MRGRPPFRSSGYLNTASKRHLSHYNVVEHTVPCQPFRERLGCVQPGREHDLRLAVKQYIPKNNPNPKESDVTFIGAHANGKPKELYEPFWDDLYESLASRNINIRSIWIADVASQGQSGILNESILGNDPSWFDHSRDLLSLVNQFSGQFRSPIIGFGHGMGASQVAFLALTHPQLFSGLILAHPMFDVTQATLRHAARATTQRDLWRTREEAASEFKSHPFWRTFDERVLEKWSQYGLRNLPTQLYPLSSYYNESAVTLTTTKAHEVFLHVRPDYVDRRTGIHRGNFEHDTNPDDYSVSKPLGALPFYRDEPAQIFHRMKYFTPVVLHIFGHRLYSHFKKKGTEDGMLWQNCSPLGRNARVASLPSRDMAPLDMVKETANLSAEFTSHRVVSREDRLAHFKSVWQDVPQQQQVQLDEQWQEAMKNVEEVLFGAGIAPRKPIRARKRENTAKSSPTSSSRPTAVRSGSDKHSSEPGIYRSVSNTEASNSVISKPSITTPMEQAMQSSPPATDTQGLEPGRQSSQSIGDSAESSTLVTTASFTSTASPESAQTSPNPIAKISEQTTESYEAEETETIPRTTYEDPSTQSTAKSTQPPVEDDDPSPKSSEQVQDSLKAIITGWEPATKTRYAGSATPSSQSNKATFCSKDGRDELRFC